MSSTGPSNAIEQYRQAKSDYLRLRNQAKKELLARFHQTANELFQMQQELLEDFGEKVSIPAKGKKIRPARSTKTMERKPTPAPAAPAPATTVSPQVMALQQQLQKARKKVAETQAAGKPTKSGEDRIYELEDALRLAQSK